LADVKQVFAAAYAPNVILRFFKEPLLGIENTAAGIRETHGVYEAFIITSSTPVGDLELVRQIKAGKMEGIRPDGSQSNGYPSPYVRLIRETPASAAEVKTKMETAPISPRLAEGIAKVWQKALLDAKAPTEKREGLDGEVFSFSAPVQNRGVIDAGIWSPECGSKTERLSARRSPQQVCQKRNWRTRTR
jgi:hypothetical protein